MRTIYVKALRISTGLGLIMIASRYLYYACMFAEVDWRTGIHRFSESPFTFSMFVVIFIVALVLGLYLVWIAWKDNSD